APFDLTQISTATGTSLKLVPFLLGLGTLVFGLWSLVRSSSFSWRLGALGFGLRFGVPASAGVLGLWSLVRSSSFSWRLGALIFGLRFGVPALAGILFGVPPLGGHPQAPRLVRSDSAPSTSLYRLRERAA